MVYLIFMVSKYFLVLHCLHTDGNLCIVEGFAVFGGKIASGKRTKYSDMGLKSKMASNSISKSRLFLSALSAMDRH